MKSYHLLCSHSATIKPFTFPLVSSCRKTSTLTITGLLLAGTLFSQKASVQITPEFKEKSDTYVKKHLYSDPTGHYVLLAEETRGAFSDKKYTPILQKFDRAFNLGLNKEIKVGDSDIEVDDMLYAQQKFVLCTQSTDTKAKKVTVSATIVGMDASTKPTRQIATIPYTSTKDLPNTMEWRVSQDTSKILLAAWADHSANKLPIQMLVSVQDQQLSNIWKQNFTLPYTSKQIKILNMVLSNTGQVFLSAKVYLDKDEKKALKNGQPPLSYKMVTFLMEAGNNKAKEITPELSGKFVTDISITSGKTGDLYCAGLYTNDNDGVVQGFFLHKINPQTGAVDLAVTKELGEADIKNVNTEKDKEGNEGLHPNYEMKNLLLREDGGLVLTAEDVYRTQESYASANRGTYTVYHTDDVLVSSISPGGTIDWVKMVRKKQAMGESRNLSSYALLVSGTNLCFIYTDDEDNIRQPVTARAKDISFKDVVTGMMTISADGKMERQKLFDINKETRTLIVP